MPQLCRAVPFGSADVPSLPSFDTLWHWRCGAGQADTPVCHNLQHHRLECARLPVVPPCRCVSLISEVNSHIEDRASARVWRNPRCAVCQLPVNHQSGKE